MRTIFKYPIKVNDDVELSMPIGAQILTVQVQHDTPCIWAIVDSGAESEIRHFKWRGTGHPMDGSEGLYIGTIQLRGGSLVFHLFHA